MSVRAEVAQRPPVPQATDPLKVEVHVVSDGFVLPEVEWLDLFSRADGAAWSCHPEVFRLWSAGLRPKGDVRLLTVRDREGTLRGVMPLMLDRVWRGPSCTPRFDYDPRDGRMVTGGRRVLPLRQLTTMASLPATMLWVGPLCRPGDEGPVAAALAAAMLGMPGWNVLVLAAEDGDDRDRWVGAFSALGARPHIQYLGRHVQNIERLLPFEDIVSQQKKKFRQNVRRAGAAANKAGLRFEILSGTEAVAPHLPTVADIARASWKHEGRSDAAVHIPYEGDQRWFFEAFFGTPLSGAEPVLGIVSDGEGPLAVLLLLRHGATVTALLTFWDGRQTAASPGLLLLGRCIDWAVAAGAARFHMNATAPWVRYLADSERTIGHVVVFGRDPWSRALAALARWSGRLA